MSEDHQEATTIAEKNENKDSCNQVNEVVFKKKQCMSTRAVRVTAALTGLLIAIGIVLTLFFMGVFEVGPDLPEVMEGEATFTSDEAGVENYHIMIDYKKNIVQLISINPEHWAGDKTFGRRLMSHAENGTANHTSANMTKIVIQDYSTKRKYFIVPRPTNSNSSTKCLYTALEGEIIPRHLLKHANLISERDEDNATHSTYRVDNETEIDVYRAKGRNGKVFEIYLHLPNGTLHMRSKEREVKFTEFRQLNCYRYYEENNTIEEAFFRSNDSKFYQEADYSSFSKINESLHDLSSNMSEALNNAPTASNLTRAPSSVLHSRRRRGCCWRNNGLDWWYGNWCGPYQGGYTNYPKSQCKQYCQQSTAYITSDCFNCLPPIDGFDSVCMEHDRCLAESESGPGWCQPMGNRCTCDFRFVWHTFYQIAACRTAACRSHALQAFIVFFKYLSCWFPVRFCFPWIRVSCHCRKFCCPRVEIYWHCISFKMCAFFGSGKVSW